MSSSLAMCTNYKRSDIKKTSPFPAVSENPSPEMQSRMESYHQRTDPDYNSLEMFTFPAFQNPHQPLYPTFLPGNLIRKRLANKVAQHCRCFCTSKEDEASTAPNDKTTASVDSDSGLSHVDTAGKARMVDVSQKKVTTREATAVATVNLSQETFRAVASNQMKKGDVLGVAQIAGILGAKQTSNLIPLCHPLPLHKVDVNLELKEDRMCVLIQATAKTTAMTGVEMEALTAATIAALTIYDMCKAMGHAITITDIKLVRKSGGKSDYILTNNDITG